MAKVIYTSTLLLLLMGCAQGPYVPDVQKPRLQLLKEETELSESSISSKQATENNFEARIGHLLAQLASSDYKERESADKELRELLSANRRAVLVFLLKGYLNSGDPEVRERIERMLPVSRSWKISPAVLYAVPNIAQLLEEGSVESICVVIRGLQELDPKDTNGVMLSIIARLIKASGNNDPDVRRAARAALSEIGKPAVQLLILALKDKEWVLRSWAAKAMGRMGNNMVVMPLVTALWDPDQEVRQYAATALGKLKDARAVNPLIRKLTDANKDVRCHAAAALGRIGDGKAVEPLIDLLRDSDEDVRREAAASLGELGDKKAVLSLVEVLKDEYWGVRIDAARALGNLKDKKAVEPLIKLLADEEWLVRSAAAGALIDIGKLALDSLINALKHEELLVRLYAAYVLGVMGDVSATQPLVDALKEHDSDVRASVARALGRIGAEKALAPLRKVWQEEKDKNVLLSTAFALARLSKDSDASKFIMESLKDESRHIRSSAAYMLGELKDAEAIGPLVDALKDKEMNVREHASRALGQMGDAAIEALLKAVKCEDADVSFYAATALAEIAGDTVIRGLVDLLRDNRSHVHRYAAMALGDITHHDFGCDYEKWKAWHEKNKNK